MAALRYGGPVPFSVSTFDAVICKRRISSNFVHNLFTTDIFFQSKLFKRWRQLL